MSLYALWCIMCYSIVYVHVCDRVQGWEGKSGTEDEFLKEMINLVLICVCLCASTCMCVLHLGAHRRQKSGLNLVSWN